MKFCGNCGAPLRAEPPAAEAELRQLTVLFCDLVGSTALSEQLDPEELREVVAAYHEACEGVVRREEGHIAQYLGDGVLVYFGYPQVHEDAAHRAVRTGLGVLAAIEALNTTLATERGITLSVRIGIHTGPVVVGDVGGGERREQLAQGKTLNLAARIQSAAAPGTAVMSEDTHRIVRGFFECQPLGAHEMKGLSEAVTLYQAERESGAQTRLDVARRAGLTPLTGRVRERAELEARWQAIKTAGGHTVLLRGEAGIGKSRLVDTLRTLAEREQAAVFESQCTPYARNATLLPIIGLLERTLGFRRDTAADERRQALHERLVRRGIGTDEALALMSILLGIPLAAADPTAGYTPQKRRARTLEILVDWLISASRDGPVLWVVEDLHWADPTTLELISAVVAAAAGTPTLAVLTSRPDFEAPWAARTDVSVVTLGRLETADAGSIAASVAHGKSLPAEVMAHIVARTEGVPLFVEEVTKAVLELGILVEMEDRYELAGPLPPDLIPSTMQDSLNARLDRLGPAKATAQLAATIGREFRFDLLSSVTTNDTARLRGDVERLVGAGLVYRNDDATEETYLFKHALIQDAAYNSLLKKSRRGLHQRIARTLSEQFPDVAASRPELVAEHFSAAGQALEAILQWGRAGLQALSRSANHESISHLRRGLGLIGDLSESVRDTHEFELTTLLIPALISTQGWAAPDLGVLYARMQEVADRQSDPALQFYAAIRPIGYHLTGGRIRQAVELCGPMMERAKSLGTPNALVPAHQTCSAVALHHAEYRRSVEHADLALALYDPALDLELTMAAGVSPFVGIRGYAAVAEWHLGRVDKALANCNEAVAMARRSGHQNSIVFAQTYRLGILISLGDTTAALDAADANIRYAREERLEFWLAPTHIYRAWALNRLGRSAEALPEIQGSLAFFRAAGNGVNSAAFATMLAEVLWANGGRPAAFAALTDGAAQLEAHHERTFEPELYRIKAEFLMAEAMGEGEPGRGGDRPGRLAAAEDAVLTALAIARAQESVPLELRAAITHYKVRRAQGRDLVVERAALATRIERFSARSALPEIAQARMVLAEPAA